MSIEHKQRQRRLAEHYLDAVRMSPRLASTAALAARTLGFPRVQINILDDETQYTLFDPYFDGIETMPRAESLCQLVVDSDDVVAIENLQTDPRSCSLPLVRKGLTGTYLGVPLASRETWPVGSLCVVDPEPRSLTSDHIAVLRQFAAIVEDQLDNVRARKERTVDQDAADVRAAIEHGEIEPWYQPIIELGTGRLAGHETLARRRRIDGGFDDPRSFLAVAEHSDLVVDVDRAVITRAVDDLARWLRVDPAARINVNLSTRHLEIADGIETIHQIVLAAGVDPGAMTVEITESRMLANESSAADAVRQLRDWGYRTVLDDFGTGFSSLDWLLQLPISGLKVDRSVTERLGLPAGDAIHRALVAIGNDLGLDVTIEGISTEAQRDAAAALGYKYAQGYLWSPPVPAVQAELHHLLRGIRAAQDSTDVPMARGANLGMPRAS